MALIENPAGRAGLFFALRAVPAPKYPEVRVKLVGGDGNAYAIIGSVVRAMRDAKLADDDQAVSGRGHERRLRPSATDMHGVGRGRVS
jgi:hypothetical protein